MKVFGPFLLNGPAKDTKLAVKPGDVVTVLVTGLLEATLQGATTAVSVTPTGTGAPAGPGSPAPGLGQLVPFLKIGPQLVTAAHTVDVPITQTGTVRLDVNAPPKTTFARGFSVYLLHTPAGEAPVPKQKQWRKFENLCAVGVDPAGLAAVVSQNAIHVYWVADGQLKTTVVTDTTATHLPVVLVAADVGWDATATVQGLVQHVLYFDETRGVLRSFQQDGVAAPLIEDLDGASSIGGRIHGLVGAFNSIVWDGAALHALYYASSDNGVGIFDLRHAQGAPTGIFPTWTFETIDGAAKPGEIAGDTGQGVRAVLDQAKQVHAFYYLSTVDGHPGKGHDLRHAVLEPGPSGTQVWRRETVDGAGRTQANASGQVNRDVGAGLGAVMHDGVMHVFYTDLTFRNLRWAQRVPAGDWKCETIDGTSSAPVPSGNPLRYGATPDAMVGSQKVAMSTPDRLSVFYYDAGARDIRHAWSLDGGQQWLFEIVDGDLALEGRVNALLGANCAAAELNGKTHLFYTDTINDQLRHAVLAP